MDLPTQRTAALGAFCSCARPRSEARHQLHIRTETHIRTGLDASWFSTASATRGRIDFRRLYVGSWPHCVDCDGPRTTLCIDTNYVELSARYRARPLRQQAKGPCAVYT